MLSWFQSREKCVVPKELLSSLNQDTKKIETKEVVLSNGKIEVKDSRESLVLDSEELYIKMKPYLERLIRDTFTFTPKGDNLNLIKSSICHTLNIEFKILSEPLVLTLNQKLFKINKTNLVVTGKVCLNKLKQYSDFLNKYNSAVDIMKNPEEDLVDISEEIFFKITGDTLAFSHFIFRNTEYRSLLGLKNCEVRGTISLQFI